MLTEAKQYTLPVPKPAASWHDAIVKVSNGVECAGYSDKHEFFLNQLGVLGVDKHGKKFYDFTIPRMFDAVYNLESNVPFGVMVGGNYTPKADLILFPAAVYTEFVCRFYLDTVADRDAFYLSFDGACLSNEHRKYLATANKFETVNLIYGSGICFPKAALEETHGVLS